MNLEKELYNILNNLGYKVFPEVASHNAKKPFIIYNVVSDNRINGLNSYSAVQDIRFKVDVYANSYEERNVITGEVKNELDLSNLNFILYNTSNTNVDGKTFKKNIDLKIWSNN